MLQFLTSALPAFTVTVVLLTVGIALGWMTAALRHRAAITSFRVKLAEATTRAESREAELLRLTHKVEDLGAADVKRAALEAQLEAERNAAREKLAILEMSELRLRETFQSIGAEALRQNADAFLQLARTSLGEQQQASAQDMEARERAVAQLIAPIHESLAKMDGTLRQVELDRVGSFQTLAEQVRALHEGQRTLAGETKHLAQALRAPTVRGRWGEIQLRRVCEMAGMLDHCDFTEQTTVSSDDGKLRPDLVVRLPGGKTIVVDAKAPLQAYLEATDCVDDTVREQRMREHSRHVRDHIMKLSAKSYWGQFDATPEFVVMFLPGETFFSAALQHDPSLIEYGVEQRVIPASPTTLIALLRSVAYGWQQARVAQNAEEISALGRELYDRIRVFAGHFDDLRRSLERSVSSYNAAVGSMERKVLPQARKFRDLGATTAGELAVAEPIDLNLRRLDAPDTPAPPPDISLGDVFAAQLEGAELSVLGGALEAKATA